MAKDMAVLEEIIATLDQMEQEPSDFEASVLETVARQMYSGRGPSAKQHRILCEMVERYLKDPELLRALKEAV